MHRYMRSPCIFRLPGGGFQPLMVSVGEDAEEGERVAVHPVVGVRRVQALQQVSDVTHVDASLAHRVRLWRKRERERGRPRGRARRNKTPLTFHHLEQRALLQALDGLELGEVVQHVAVQLQREAGAVAGVLPVHQHLVDLLHHLLGRYLTEERERRIKSKGSVPGAWILTVKPVSWITITSCSLDSSPPSASLLPSCFESASSSACRGRDGEGPLTREQLVSTKSTDAIGIRNTPGQN
ncbi:hypothetical protein EYF80_045743 [Liparis tanakae]|uniref:Uncharacterized protein n=1 Tax=Liparis tanakae TaxID=230148 RepID=A0A4Z2FSC6_9TELE|nr:hypothetical protein EYF80_045743 [Liparis tanakae]